MIVEEARYSFLAQLRAMRGGTAIESTYVDVLKQLDDDGDGVIDAELALEAMLQLTPDIIHLCAFRLSTKSVART